MRAGHPPHRPRTIPTEPAPARTEPAPSRRWAQEREASPNPDPNPNHGRRNAKRLYEQTIRNLNYGEYFDAVDKNLVQLPNGKFAAYDIETYTKMRKEGRIKIGSFDTLIDPATGKPPVAEPLPLAGAAADTAAPTRGPAPLDYQALVERLKAGGVEGVVFQGARGDTAIALLGGDRLASTEVKASWKKAELLKVMGRLDVPNNFAELSVAVPGIPSSR